MEEYKLIVDERPCPLVEEKVKMDVEVVPVNYGQTMDHKKFMGAAKPWKPKGRK